MQTITLLFNIAIVPHCNAIDSALPDPRLFGKVKLTKSGACRADAFRMGLWMIVDDRLETVLRTVAAGPGAFRTQFRQLADILGRTSAESWSPAHVAALRRIDSLHAALGDTASAALLSNCALRSPILIEHFADLGPKVALAAIMSARLREAEWLGLIPDLPVQARGFLRHRRDLGHAVEALLARLGITDFALPLPQGVEPLVTDAARPQATSGPLPVPPAQHRPVYSAAPHLAPSSRAPQQSEGIGAIVQRIETLRSAREVQAADAGHAAGQVEGGGQKRLPFAEEPQSALRELTSIDLRIDAAGTVTAADAPHSAMLVGLRPFAADTDTLASCDAASLHAVRARLPVEAGLCAIEGTAPVAGTWRIDAAPLFTPETGHFLGYHARLRRPPAALANALAAANDDATDEQLGSSVDRLRQILHELRTPINAIQGFAELIQQQMLGPTPHQYRSLAAGIASDAARMLAGFEDVERLVGLENGKLANGGGGADLAALLNRLVAQLEPILAPREVKLRCDGIVSPLPVAMDPLELERALWRLLSLIAGAAAPGERLALNLKGSVRDGMAQLSLPLPAALAMRDDAALMAPDASPSGASGGAMLGGGFALRLAAAEIRAAGGRFARKDARLDIGLPLLTAAQSPLSQAVDPAG